MTAYLSALAAGVLSFFSPCILPLLPGYLSMLSGFSASELMKGEGSISHKKVAANAALFVGGFTLAFCALGATASFIGGFMQEWRGLLQKIFGVALVLFGLHMTGALNFTFLNYERRFSLRNISRGPAGSVLMGFAFALGWSPCIGPMLAGILGMAAGTGTAWKGTSLLFVYSIGIGIPFMAAALLTSRFFALLARFKSAMRWVEIVAGAAMILLGLLLFTDRLMFIG